MSPVPEAKTIGRVLPIRYFVDARISSNNIRQVSPVPEAKTIDRDLPSRSRSLPNEVIVLRLRVDHLSQNHLRLQQKLQLLRNYGTNEGHVLKEFHPMSSYTKFEDSIFCNSKVIANVNPLRATADFSSLK